MSTNALPDLSWLRDANKDNFPQKALELFSFQYQSNNLYKDYCNALHIDVAAVSTLTDIPFLPISFFKSHEVKTGFFETALTFESSGTTGMIPSRHHIAHPEYYEYAYRSAFHHFYGAVEDYIIIGLLPSYLERKHSSLVYMVNDLIRLSGRPESGFYLDEFEKLAQVLSANKQKKILLIGVTFALLDFAEAYPMSLDNVIVMETGGMKGRKEEWTRMEVHDYLKQQWQLPVVHSEYGMSELLSQAYAVKDGFFACDKTMQVLLRDESDPLHTFAYGSGCLNVIDLANIDSCAFIATEDVGKIHYNDTFEVLGRRDFAALRGCSLMVV
ncbi:acyl transferase [Taibaiella sp. KBW10]|uniref:LuxE/PaaK family acyltransferase n=1 Tax=Taibaiella sp. KBW10 TaxID=2153357 RepID=UPI000F58FDC3|nr:acyl transferase [Taibaiella sp. KBW10]RQO30794.1 acyl transferase [Taibaiella sp. KBW10]